LVRLISTFWFKINFFIFFFRFKMIFFLLHWIFKFFKGQSLFLKF
jgi:hypothetical protein